MLVQYFASDVTPLVAENVQRNTSTIVSLCTRSRLYYLYGARSSQYFLLALITVFREYMLMMNFRYMPYI
jgi:hypothetical protein